MTKLFEWIKSHPLYAILIVAALIILVFLAANGIGKSIETYRANKFDKQQAINEQAVKDANLERDAAIKRANDAEAKALLKETEAQEFKNLIYASGGKIEKAADQLQKDIENAKANAGSCAGSVDPRGCTCAKLRAAGFECR